MAKRARIDVPVRIRIQGDAVPGGLIGDSVRLLERVAYTVAAEDIRLAGRKLNLPQWAFADAIPRLRRMRGRQVTFSHAETGSVVLVGTISAVGLWLLNQTLGESFKDAWKKSELHKKLSAWIQVRLDSYPQRFVSTLRRFARQKRLPMSASVRGDTVDVDATATSPQPVPNVVLDLPQPRFETAQQLLLTSNSSGAGTDDWNKPAKQPAPQLLRKQ